VSRGFYSENELRKMGQHPSMRAIRIGRTKPYDCSYPVMAEKPRIAERSKDGETDRKKKKF
jgi:hypothetical protein